MHLCSGTPKGPGLAEKKEPSDNGVVCEQVRQAKKAEVQAQKKAEKSAREAAEREKDLRSYKHIMQVREPLTSGVFCVPQQSYMQSYATMSEFWAFQLLHCFIL